MRRTPGPPGPADQSVEFDSGLLGWELKDQSQNTASDHVEINGKALAPLPFTTGSRPGNEVLIRTDGAGGSQEFLNFLP
ncbi:hypothetical protein [Rhodococcus sp. JVH1]|uniref:hypothetical protein n=1 Tax=Rhodococcus sp. JVH1 TaxID=745408 RepID=UPI0002722283|nr:hypothetical protein [Rhodococcus sp. JVH1]EJI95630.1 putative transposase domain protein [Rhodococcus sp. JVH1]